MQTFKYMYDIYVNMTKNISNQDQRKADRFRKVAVRRVQEIIRKMRLLRNCANKNNYYYTEDQVNKIITTIDSEWKKVKAEFNSSKSKKEEFSL